MQKSETGDVPARSAPWSRPIKCCHRSNVGIYGTSQITLDSIVGATITSTVFGSTVTSPTVTTVSNSSDVGIFGSTAPSGSTLSATVTGSSNVGIFGSTSSTGSSLTATVSGSSNVGIFGSASQTTTKVTVSGSSNVGIFGLTSSTGSNLSALVSSGSSNVSIFGSVVGGDKITVQSSSNVGIYGLIASEARLDRVQATTVTLSEFGTTTPTITTVTANNSQNVGIFGSTSSTGSSLTAIVGGSSNVSIFGSASGANSITVSSSSNVGIYGASNDTIDLEDVSLAHVEGGVFGTLDLNLSSTQSLAGGLLSIAINQSSTNSARGDIEEVVGSPGNDIILGNELDNRIETGAGNDTVDGRAGSDIYVFSGRGLGNDTILDTPTGTGRDTLDFAAFDAPLNLDLALTTPQNLVELTLTLGASDSIENVVGTSYDDQILGNVRDNSLYGAAGADRLDGRTGNDKLVADLPAVVMLDFDSAYRADRGGYNYNIAEGNAIQQRLQAAYSAFNWIFTQSESQAQALTADMGRNFVRLAFSQGRGGGISGDAGQVDFRNILRSVVTEVNINSLLPTVRSLLLSQIGPNYSIGDYSNMIVALTSTIAEHELGHTAGLRHGDSFGPIGSG